MYKIRLLSIFLVMFFSTTLYSASFDCKKAQTEVENLICSDDDLSVLDVMLSKNYQKLLNNSSSTDKSELKANQRNWLKIRNNNCTYINSCMYIYSKRILKLKNDLFTSRLKQEIIELNNTNELIWNKDFINFINSYFSNHRSNLISKNKKLTKLQIIELLSGPPHNLNHKDNLIIGGACRAHSCSEKAFFILNKKTLETMFGVINFITNNGDIVNEAIFTVFYKNDKFYNTHIDTLKKVVKKYSQFNEIKKVKINIPNNKLEQLHNAIIMQETISNNQIPNKSMYKVAFSQLNERGNKEAIVLFNDAYYCGSGGCSMDIYSEDKTGQFELVSSHTLCREKIWVSSSSNNRWKNIIIEVSNGTYKSTKNILKYTGNTYPLNPSTQPEYKGSLSSFEQLKFK